MQQWYRTSGSEGELVAEAEGGRGSKESWIYKIAGYYSPHHLLSLEWKRVGVMDNDSGYMKGQMSLDNSVGKSEKKNDQD